MNLKRVRWGAAIAGALAAEVIMIALAFGWVAIYSYWLHPGEGVAFYERYAMGSSPWVSVIGGVPVFYFVCRWIGVRSAARAVATALAVFGVYFVLDAPLVLLGDNPEMARWLPAINYPAKLLACYLGGKSAA